MSAVWSFIVSQYRHDRLHFWLGCLIAILPAAAGILLLGVSGWFITAAAIAGLSGVFLNIFVPSALIRALAIIRTAGRYGERVLTHDATFRFLTDLRNRLFAAYARRGAQGRRSALLMNRLTLDIAALDAVYLRVVVPVILASVVAISLLLVWASISIALLVTGLTFLGAWMALAWLSYSRADKGNARRLDAASEAMRLRAAELAAGRRDLAVYGGLERGAEAILKTDERLATTEEAEEKRLNRLSAASFFFGQAFLAATLVVSSWNASVGTISVALAVGLVLVVMALPDIMGGTLQGLSRLPRTALAARRSLGSETHIGPLTSEAMEVTSRQVPQESRTVLRFDDVSYRYPGACRDVLHEFSLEIAHGDIVAIAGRSGCGKSTMAALAARLRKPDTGQIELNGRDLEGYDEDELRRSITVLSQRSYIFNDTVAANLRIADPAATDADLWVALKKAALTERIERSKEGLQTVIGEEGLGLSGGEQRRLALARAFLTSPDLFILDEMTEGLDEATAREVLQSFWDCRGEAAVLMIAHRKIELSTADRIVTLRDTVAAQN